MKHTDAIVNPEEFGAQGYCVQDAFLTPEESAHLLGLITRYRAAHEAPEVYRKVRGGRCIISSSTGIRSSSIYPRSGGSITTSMRWSIRRAGGR